MEVSLGTIYLIRHGEVDWNRKNSYVGSTDIPLNATGRSQAMQVAEHLKDKKISAVYSSNLMRARVTAEIIAEKFGIPVTGVPAFQEVDYGEWEGLSESEIKERYQDIYARWREDPVGINAPNGESFGELRDRAYPAFIRIAEAHPDDNVVVVAHKSTNRVLLCRLLGIDVNLYRQIAQENACINTISVRSGGRLVVDTINITRC